MLTMNTSSRRWLGSSASGGGEGGGGGGARGRGTCRDVRAAHPTPHPTSHALPPLLTLVHVHWAPVVADFQRVARHQRGPPIRLPKDGVQAGGEAGGLGSREQSGWDNGGCSIGEGQPANSHTCHPATHPPLLQACASGSQAVEGPEGRARVQLLQLLPGGERRGCWPHPESGAAWRGAARRGRGCGGKG